MDRLPKEKRREKRVRRREKRTLLHLERSDSDEERGPRRGSDRGRRRGEVLAGQPIRSPRHKRGRVHGVLKRVVGQKILRGNPDRK